jgi:hypothetical protein
VLKENFVNPIKIGKSNVTAEYGMYNFVNVKNTGLPVNRIDLFTLKSFSLYLSIFNFNIRKTGAPAWSWTVSACFLTGTLTGMKKNLAMV